MIREKNLTHNDNFASSSSCHIWEEFPLLFHPLKEVACIIYTFVNSTPWPMLDAIPSIVPSAVASACCFCVLLLLLPTSVAGCHCLCHPFHLLLLHIAAFQLHLLPLSIAAHHPFCHPAVITSICCCHCCQCPPCHHCCHCHCCQIYHAEKEKATVMEPSAGTHLPA